MRRDGAVDDPLGRWITQPGPPRIGGSHLDPTDPELGARSAKQTHLPRRAIDRWSKKLSTQAR